MRIFTAVFIIFITINLTACKSLINSFVDYAEPPAEKYSKPEDPSRILPKNPKGCPVWKKNSLVRLESNLTLPKGCKYDRVSILIVNKSNFTFDCNGAKFNGLDKEFRQEIGSTYKAGQEPINVGIQIQSSENYQSRNVVVKNCNLKNYVRGIVVHFSMSESSKSDLRNNINVEALENHLRSISPKNIRVEDSNISFSHKDGVYVARFVTDFTLDGSSIDSTGAVGLYIDSGSAKNTITNTTFTKNGFSDYDTKKHKIKQKIEDYSREAIAIDSSINNIIEKNTFEGNSRGSVFIYKNCNEHYKDANQIPRYQSADGNTIRNNTFNGDKIGVWVASRQSADLKALDCGSPRVAISSVSYGPKKDKTYIYEDFAKNNLVSNNVFNGVNIGVIVEDDDNNVRGNTFNGSSQHDVKVGTEFRTDKLSHPVTNVDIQDNTFNSKASEHVKLVYNPVDITITGNTPSSVNK